MKKISILFAAMAVALGFSSCKETWDDNPVLGVHEGDIVENFLNVPEMANMAVTITEENANDVFHLTCSQPEQYGYAASVGYQVEVSLDKEFETPEVEGCPATVLLSTLFWDCSEINPTRKSVAEALCKMINVQDASQVPTDFYPVYFRLRANVINESGAVVPGTAFTSNAVCFKNISCGYLAVVVPGLPTGIYVRGNMNGWLNDQLNDGKDLEILPNYEFLTTTEANTYELDYIEIEKGVTFKIADKGWGDPNLGMGAGDIKFGEKYEFGWNTSDISLTEDFKGSITLKGSGQKWEATFDALEAETPGQLSGIFLRGDMNGWDTSMEFVTTDVKNTWEIKNVTIATGQTFKIADESWGDINFGASKNSDGEDEPMTPGVKYSLEKGGGNITVSEPFTGTVTLRLKGGKYTLTLTAN